ncbi:MAG: hypothetical protein LLF95_09515 [Bacteroidales bacterium]|nr:hypothetical protein [Bacteroidales bacterium]
MQIRHLRHNSIDYEKWDNAINLSVNQLGYGFSWYLDIVSPDWEALVSDNYEYIMPLTVKRKYGIPYIVQPMLTQQLGIFSSKEISEEIIQLFIKEIPYYSYEINLNENNNFNTEISELPNYILNLNEHYELIYKKYSKNTIRNIEKTRKQNLSVQHNIPIDEFVNFYNSTEKNFISNTASLLEELLTTGSSKGAIALSGVKNPDNKLISALCIFVTGKRIVYLLPVSNEEGKKSSAMFLQVDDIICNNAGTDMILDFEGSRIEGIARFYKGFGAVNQPYYILKKFRPDFLVGKI